MTALKAAVVLMGVALVVGFTALFVMWADERAASQGGVVAAVATAEREPVDAVVPIPPGARVLRVASGPERVDVLVENPDGTRDLYQIRRDDGEVAGILRFRAATP